MPSILFSCFKSSSHFPRKDHGLFDIPRHSGQSPPQLADPSIGVGRVDIIAVHGLGGHWLRTWQWGDGEDAAVWLRDRIPDLLAHENVEARVKSYGYNSGSLLTRSVGDLESAAKDLLKRIVAIRKTQEQRQTPIIFVAHSLGGLLVKTALIVAKIHGGPYADIVDNTKGCLFLGVPHSGAGLAIWAKRGAEILRAVSVGFVGNPNFANVIRNLSEWYYIGRHFAKVGGNLQFRTFYEIKKTGSTIIVDRASATMNAPGEEVYAAEADHRTICQFPHEGSQRFLLVSEAMVDLVRTALASDDYAHATIRKLLTGGYAIYEKFKDSGSKEFGLLEKAISTYELAIRKARAREPPQESIAIVEASIKLAEFYRELSHREAPVSQKWESIATAERLGERAEALSKGLANRTRWQWARLERALIKARRAQLLARDSATRSDVKKAKLTEAKTYLSQLVKELETEEEEYLARAARYYLGWYCEDNADLRKALEDAAMVPS